jgi:hypothetical protein
MHNFRFMGPGVLVDDGLELVEGLGIVAEWDEGRR